MRWLSHHKRMNELRDILGKDLLVLRYERFARGPAEVVGQLQRFLGLKTDLPVPDVNTESMDKWQDNLTAEQLTQIEGVVGFSVDHVGRWWEVSD